MTLLIKNVRVVTGGKDPGPAQDVFVNGTRVSAIGRFPAKKANTVIDGQGAYAAPGFIDVHAESDHSFGILRNPGQSEFLRQGVTTVVLGHEGISLAPFLPSAAELFAPWSETARRTNVRWRSVTEFFRALAHRRFGVNVATLVGYDTARVVAETGRARWGGTPHIHLLRRAVAEGAFGISCRVGSAPLARDIPRLAHLAASAGGFLAAAIPPVVSEARDAGGEAVERTLTSMTTGECRVLMSHGGLLGVPEERLRSFLSAVDALPEDRGFAFEVHPSQSTTFPITSFLPAWARAEGDRALRFRLEDPWFVKEVLSDMSPVHLERFVLRSAVRAEPFVGETLSAIKEHYGLKDAKHTLIRLMRETRLRAFVAETHAKRDIHMELLRHPRALVASYGTGLPRPAVARGSEEESPFLRFLALAEKEGILPLADAIRKVTADAAEFLGLADRGTLEEGAIADIVGFRDGKMHFVVVGGAVVLEGGKETGAYAGRLLRHERRAP